MKLDHGITTTYEKITPEIAAQWLKKQLRNRPLSISNLDYLCSEIQRGRWQPLNGFDIKFDENGNLFDGQHRLAAVIKTGITIESFVKWGVSRETFPTADTGKPRSGSDTLSLLGEKSAARLSSAVRLLFLWDNGIDIGSGYHVSNEMIVETLENNVEIRDSNKKLSSNYRDIEKTLMPGAIAVFLHFIFTKKSKQDADDFFAKLATGADMSKDDMVLRLRNRLIVNKTEKAKLSRKDIIALSIKAWNLFRTKKTVKVLKWSSSGDNSEAFPLPI